MHIAYIKYYYKYSLIVVLGFTTTDSQQPGLHALMRNRIPLHFNSVLEYHVLVVFHPYMARWYRTVQVLIAPGRLIPPGLLVPHGLLVMYI